MTSLSRLPFYGPTRDANYGFEYAEFHNNYLLCSMCPIDKFKRNTYRIIENWSVPEKANMTNKQLAAQPLKFYFGNHVAYELKY